MLILTEEHIRENRRVCWKPLDNPLGPEHWILRTAEEPYRLYFHLIGSESYIEYRSPESYILASETLIRLFNNYKICPYKTLSLLLNNTIPQPSRIAINKLLTTVQEQIL